MPGSAPHIARYKPLVLLVLFTTGLVLQGLHQFNTPAQMPTDCGTPHHHFHQDTDLHHCDLCDYKITAVQQATVWSEPLRWTLDDYQGSDAQLASHHEANFTNRGPPLT